jgi:hypothetical protein
VAATVALSAPALQCLARMQRAVGRGASGVRLAPEALYADESGIAAGLGRTVAGEVSGATAALLQPHLRGRLRAAELLGPILAR